MSEFGSTQTTNGICIAVEPKYVPEESSIKDSFWLFTYQVTITNTAKDTVQLLSRHWIITDATGKEEQVKGPGVVGETPILKENGHFRYSSFCPLSTSFGTMCGSYLFQKEDGTQFEAEIAPFILAVPGCFH